MIFIIINNLFLTQQNYAAINAKLVSSTLTATTLMAVLPASVTLSVLTTRSVISTRGSATANPTWRASSAISARTISTTSRPAAKPVSATPGARSRARGAIKSPTSVSANPMWWGWGVTSAKRGFTGSAVMQTTAARAVVVIQQVRNKCRASISRQLSVYQSSHLLHHLNKQNHMH